MASLSFDMPVHACNAHLHIIDPAFPNDGKAREQIGTVETYQKIASEYHIPRAVFVQAKPFGLDNSCLLDAVQKFGMQNARGIAVLNSSVTDKELEKLNAGGIRGVRFSVWNPKNAVVSFDRKINPTFQVYEMVDDGNGNLVKGALIANQNTRGVRVDDSTLRISTRATRFLVQDTGSKTTPYINVQNATVTYEASPEHGKVYLDKEVGAEGDRATIYALPDKGYKVGSVTVNGVEIQADENGNYAFVLAKGNNVVVVTFVEA